MPNNISIHDKFFKSTMSRTNVAREFLEQYLPCDVKDKIDFNSLRLQKDTFVDERFKNHLVDLLYSANFGKETGYIYVLFEHLSNPDEMIAFRMLKYITQITDLHLIKNKSKKIPLVYPIIFYTGNKKYNFSTDFFDLYFDNKDLAKNIFLKPFQMINLQDVSDEELQKMIWFGIVAKTFKHRFENSQQTLQKILPNLIIIDANGDVDFINLMVKYLIEAGNINDKNLFFDNLIENLSEKTGEKIMTIADGLRLEGKLEAQEQIAKAMLSKKFLAEKVAEFTGLPIEKIRKLQEK